MIEFCHGCGENRCINSVKILDPQWLHRHHFKCDFFQFEDLYYDQVIEQLTKAGDIDANCFEIGFEDFQKIYESIFFEKWDSRSHFLM